jgi:hypothetical protein
MKNVIAIILLVAVTQADVRADEKDTVAAALALAKAKRDMEASRPKAPSPTGNHYHTSYATAAAESRGSGKPIFISVNTDCSRLCKDLVGDYIVLHVKQFVADGVTPLDRPRLLLTIPHATADRQWCLGQWDTLPTAQQVRDAERRMKPTVPGYESIPVRHGEMRVIENGAILMPSLPVSPRSGVAPPLPTIIRTPIYDLSSVQGYRPALQWYQGTPIQNGWNIVAPAMPSMQSQGGMICGPFG